MKSLVIIFLLGLSVLFTANAQRNRKPDVVGSFPRLSWNIVCPDTSNNAFFEQYPFVKSIRADMGENPPATLHLRYDTAATNGIYGESFDMEFEGDTYLFKQKFTPIHFVVPSFSAAYIDGDNEPGRTGRNMWMTIHKDSIVYSIYERYQLIGKSHSSPFLMTPQFKGDMDEVIHTVTDAFRLSGVEAVGDSILVFGGIVNRAGHLSALDLLFGDTTPFADWVKAQLESILVSDGVSRDLGKWTQGFIFSSGRPVRVPIKLYVRLNEDGEFTVSPSRQVFSFAGD